MKKLLILLLLISTYLPAQLHVAVSILPQQTFLQAIAGDKVNITLMVKPGNSPHTYEPKPSQMISIAKADLYLSMDVEFEHVWLPKFKNLNKKMAVYSLTTNILKMPIGNDHHANHLDPHVWTSPHNVKIIVQNIYHILITLDPKNQNYYQQNLIHFLAHIKQTDQEIKRILLSLNNNRSFMVFHPSWGYYAKEYNLTQIAVEVSGKNPKPREIVSLIKKAKKAQVSAIFTQPEFSDSSAKIIAKELKIPVVKVSPMAINWAENLLSITKSIAGIK